MVRGRRRKADQVYKLRDKISENNNNMEPIHKAAAAGDLDALRRELERGVSPDSVCPHGFVPLHFAVTGDLDRLRKMRAADELRRETRELWEERRGEGVEVVALVGTEAARRAHFP